jgi:hypothetical protein
LSNSVAEGLRLLKDPKFEKIIEFIDLFDNFFDYLNVSSLAAGKFSRNTFKAPYRSSGDFRLEMNTVLFM